MTIKNISGTLCNFNIDINTIDEKYCDTLILNDNTTLKYQSYILMNYSPIFQKDPEITLEFLSKQDYSLVKQLFDLLHCGTYELDNNSSDLEEIVKFLKIHEMLLDPCLNITSLALGLLEKIYYQKYDKLRLINTPIILNLSYYVCMSIIEKLYDIKIFNSSDTNYKSMLPLSNTIKTILDKKIFITKYFENPDYEDLTILARDNDDYYNYFFNKINTINSNSCILKKSKHLNKLIKNASTITKLGVRVGIGSIEISHAVIILDTCDYINNNNNNFVNYNTTHFMKVIFVMIMNEKPEFQKCLLDFTLIQKTISDFLTQNNINVTFKQLYQHFDIMSKHQGLYPQDKFFHKLIFVALTNYTNLYLRIILALENEEINFDEIVCLRDINRDFCNKNMFHYSEITMHDHKNDNMIYRVCDRVSKFLFKLNKHGRINVESLNIHNKYLKEKIMNEMPTLTKPAIKSCNK